MKKFILVTVLSLIMVCVATSLKAQVRDTPFAGCTWQLVSNIHEPSKVTVQFYTGDGVLMHEETLYNKKLNISKRKTVRRLNEALRQVYHSWVINRTMEKDLIAKKLN